MLAYASYRVKPTKIIAVVGSKKSGKTTIVELIVKHLSSLGLKVGTLKHIHHPDFTADREGTDTWRHRSAGAIVSSYISAREAGSFTSLKREPEALEEALSLVKVDGLDVLVIEGFHRLVSSRADVGKVVAFKDIKDLEERLPGTVGPIIALCTFNKKVDRERLPQNFTSVMLMDEVEVLLKRLEDFVKSP